MIYFDFKTDLPVVVIYDEDLSWPQEDIADRQASAYQLYNGLIGVGHPVQMISIQSDDIETVMQHIHPDENLILNWCEEFPGIPHSEYQVAQSLEKMGFTFTGAGARTLELSQDKRWVKQMLEKQQIPTPAWQVCTSDRNITWNRFPAIVKPTFEHCSYGITRESVVLTTSELIRRVRYVLEELHEPALIEEFIDSREFHVGVIGNGQLHVLPPGEIDYSSFPDIHDRLCTYESNFDRSSLAYRLTLPRMDVGLSGEEKNLLEKTVIAAYRAVGCRDYARMDVRLKDGKFYLLDVNPNPDISSDTSLALGAKLAGLSYGKLGSLLVNLAAHRHPLFRSKNRQV